MQVQFENGESKQIRIKVALYSELFETFIEENEYFEVPTDEKLNITLTQAQLQKYEEFISLVIENKEAEGLKKFKPNLDFSQHYFSECSDEEILDFFEIAHYLESPTLHESLNIFLGGLLQVEARELEELYSVEESQLREEAEQETVKKYDYLLVEELHKVVPKMIGLGVTFTKKLLSAFN
jgi:hypothetical protein